MHDLHMTINIDGVVRHVFRFLSSGCYNTAHMGTWIHNMMEQIYFMACIRKVKQFRKFMKRKGGYSKFFAMYEAWKCGSPLFHHSDDMFKVALLLTVLCMEFIDPMRYYAENFNMVHKVEVEPYPSSKYDPMIEELIPYMKESGLFDDIFFDGIDSFKTGSPHGDMKLYGYRDRVNTWRPLISKYDTQNKLADSGCVFLKHFFSFFTTANGSTYIVPRRERTDLFPKMIYPVSSLNSVADHILKIRAYLYSTNCDYALYLQYMRIHDALMKKYGKEVLDPRDLKRSLRDKQLERIKHKLGIDDLTQIVNRPPTYDEVCNHYLPQPGLSEMYYSFALRRNRDVSIMTSIKKD